MSMADSASSSNSDVSNSGKYDGLLGYSGKDRRTNFTGHLYASFCLKKIKAYIDKYDL